MSPFAYLRERNARKRLAEIVAHTRASEEVQRFRRNRAAQLSNERKARIAALVEGIV